ncbi:DUF4981 domain-containing protein [Puteibacter caeruleilacunae]|nr:DUF4981 domain-containing protein [Puteibacter caeruleilacunae]
MRTIILHILAYVLVTFGCIAQEKKGAYEWENPIIHGINRENAGIIYIPVVDNDMDNKIVLDGVWRFHYSSCINDRPVLFYQNEYNVNTWKSIPVPSNWQLHGYGDLSINHRELPFVYSPPNVPHTGNAVGSYVKEFSLPNQWQEREVFINFNSVSSAYYLWVNGHYVGYSQGSKIPSRFNITKYIRKGKNRLAVEVYEYSDASYLENMETWNLSGIEREVYLYSTPKVHLKDYHFKTYFDEQLKDAVLEGDLMLFNYDNQSRKNCHLKINLYDINAELVAAQKVSFNELEAGTSQNQRFLIPISSPAKWSAESPNLYKIEMILTQDDQELEIINDMIGFRQVEIRYGHLLINGKKVILKGVNHIAFSCTDGANVSEEEMIREICQMKRNNINAVRTSGGTHPSKWYKLCDKYGLYIIDEAPISIGMNHGRKAKLISNSRAWSKSMSDKVMGMFEMNKNHPSIIVWSIGTNSVDGYAFTQCSQKLKKRIFDRPVTFDGKQFESVSDHIDIHFKCCKEIKELKSYVINKGHKPVIASEFIYAQGISCGGMGEKWSKLKEIYGGHGGFISYWKNQELKQRYPNGGGEYEQVNFREVGKRSCVNHGIVNCLDQSNGELVAVKKLFEPVKIEIKDSEKGVLTIFNNHLFSDLSKFDLYWDISEDDRTIQQGIIDSLLIKPGEQNELYLPLKSFEKKKGAEYWLNISLRTKNDEIWAAAGHEIAFSQYNIPNPLINGEILSSSGPVKVKKIDDGFVVMGAKYKARIVNGVIQSYRYEGDDLFVKGKIGLLNVNRSPIDNDIRVGYLWKEYALDYLKRIHENTRLISEDKKQVIIECENKYESSVDAGFKHQCTYRFFSDGLVQVDNEIIPYGDLPELGRIGVKFHIPDNYRQLYWYGRGPYNNYCDRKCGTKIGLYHELLTDAITKEGRSGSVGNKQDIRWLSFRDDRDKGLLLKLTNNASIYYYKEGNGIQWGRKSQSLNKEIIYLEINAKDRGVGNTLGGNDVANRFKCMPQTVKFTFFIQPLREKSNSILMGRSLNCNM